MADNEQKSAPAPYVPLSQIAPAELMKAFQDDGVIATPPAAPAVVSEKPVVSETSPTPTAAPPAPARDDLPALVRLARERDAFRKETEPLKPYVEALKVFSPTEAQRLAAARASGDPVAALAALGFSHEQYTQKLLGMKDEPRAQPKAEPSSEIESLRGQVESLRNEREMERVATLRTQMLGQMRSILKDSPKFQTVNQLEDYEGVERVLIQYNTEHGQLPGATLEESVTLAAELYEAQLKKEAQRWAKVLTPVAQGASTAVQRAPESPPSTGTVQTRTLTNANTSAPAAARTVPKTRAEIMAAIVEGRDDALE